MQAEPATSCPLVGSLLARERTPPPVVHHRKSISLKTLLGSKNPLQAGGGYKTPHQSQGSHIYHEILCSPVASIPSAKRRSSWEQHVSFSFPSSSKIPKLHCTFSPPPLRQNSSESGPGLLAEFLQEPRNLHPKRHSSRKEAPSGGKVALTGTQK